MEPLKPRDKVTQHMTRDGLTLDNQTTGESVNVSSREAEQEYTAQPEGAAEKILERADELHDRHKAKKAAKDAGETVAQATGPVSRLQFTAEERASPELAPYIKKAEKRADKLEAAKEALPKKRVVTKETVYDEAKGKAKSRLYFDKVEKASPQLKPNPASRPIQEAGLYLHGKIHEVEHENVGVEGGHKGEELAERKAGRMIREMVTRDKNRCALTFWGVANETQPSGPRNAFLRHLIACCREIDDTRLIVAAFDLVRFDRQRQLFVMDDPFIGELDVVAINKYMGWYHPWPLTPDKAVWDVARGKPLIISEFGGEALYGQHGPADVASSWSEEYQEALYRDNLRMFENIPNLRGVSPRILFDFRSPFRFHPANQEGWNRKGLVSDQGYRKKAWYLMKAYYDKH